MTLCLPKSERVVREQEAEAAKRRGWAVGREASLLMHRWLDAADEKGSVEIDMITDPPLDDAAWKMAVSDLFAWHEKRRITRYQLNWAPVEAIFRIERVN